MEIPYGSVFSKLYKKAFEDHIFDSAAQVGFYFSFALFPLLIFLISLFGLIVGGESTYLQDLYFYLSRIIPETAFELVKNTIDEVAKNSSGNKITIGLLIALWSASAGIDSLRIALNRVYGFEEQRPWILTKVISIIFTIVLTFLVSAALVGVFYGWQAIGLIFSYAGFEEPGSTWLVILQWVVTLSILLLIYEMLYNVLPDRRPFEWQWVTPGALIAIGLWLALSFGWRTYLHFFDNYDRIYGSIGAGIVLMLWLYLTGLAILIGGMINSILKEIRDESTEKEKEK